ncbi:hypothetical protein GS462_00320 [Rhodococcus hoagii]|nr:hypothetical protein [Prescottella equi]MBM4648855.1 hypothetical protein [Prescottella equi]MBM4687067.1 hypothetical protein [Prescottella equi]
MGSMTDIRLRDIRAHEGSQARAWEELAYQLRPTPGDGHVETRKTRAPDGGVEWYELYEDGHQEGFQAKFNENLENALGGMLESVKTVAAKRPNMTHLTFIVPYDFTDAASERSKSDQDRWDDAVKRWKKDVDGAARLTFGVTRAGDIVDALLRPNQAGRRAYWFGEVELTANWLSQRWTEARSVAGDRYTPEADTASKVQSALDAVCAGQPFRNRVNDLITQTELAYRQDRGIWDTKWQVVADHLMALQVVRERALEPTNLEGDDLPIFEIDFESISECAENLIAIARDRSMALPSYEQRNLNRALTAADALRRFSSGALPNLYRARAVAIEGAAGQGKTHALIHRAKLMLDRDAPAVVVMGQRVKDGNWWPALSGALGGLQGTSDDFLQALDSLAEANGGRAVIMIDALNEAQDPRMWRNELPALLTQMRNYPHLALIVSYRTDYRDVIDPPTELLRINHPGLAGHEREALASYCSLYKIPVPTHAALDSDCTSPLFLRMYCAVIAGGVGDNTDPPSRSTLFARFAQLQSARVRDHLQLPPTSTVVSDALSAMADRLLANRGQAVARANVEPALDALLPGRLWPNTLFHRLVSEGLVEVRPDYDGVESVSFPFQAYSEHLLADRFLELAANRRPSWIARNFARVLRRPKTTMPPLVAKELRNNQWLWRAMSVLLPEKHNVELIDLVPDQATDYRMRESIRESLIERTAASFGVRALALLEGELDLDGQEWVDTVLSLAPRIAHPANSDWLHSRLTVQVMADRDATWSIDAFQADDDSPAFARLAAWADDGAPTAPIEQVRLVTLALMWLLTSPNRFLRDRASKCLVALLARHLVAAEPLLAAAQEADDLYVQERVLTCVYGAVMVGGDHDLPATKHVVHALEKWHKSGLPIHVIARDSARGAVAWAHGRGVAKSALLESFSPTYGAAAPDEPPTAEELEERYGHVKDHDGHIVDWRAESILLSCLDWYGDFNKYVVKSDVEFFSRFPLSGPPPTEKYNDPNGHVDSDWAGRWIANRAIELGWTPARFDEFERNHDLHKGREGHKAERFGKKYQWIAHHELLARLADNFHPAYESWNPDPMVYEGPWPWYGRDFDPSLPPSVRIRESNICEVESREGHEWAGLISPALDPSTPAKEWVANVDDLPTATSMFEPIDESGRRWVAIQRYSTWNRENSQHKGITKRELDVFFLQFSWLAPRGQGQDLHDLIVERGLSGRWMPDVKRTHTQYLGEQEWAPIVFTASAVGDDLDIPSLLLSRGLEVRPAVEQYLWEGNVLDCSLDASVDFYTPTSELLGGAHWVGHTAEWRDDDGVVAKTVRIDDGENGQDVLLVNPDWLDGRLRDLDAELVIGTLSEKHAVSKDENPRSMAFSDIWYVAAVTPGEPVRLTGPLINVRD